MYDLSRVGLTAGVYPLVLLSLLGWSNLQEGNFDDSPFPTSCVF
jgi:hypothetical protein